MSRRSKASRGHSNASVGLLDENTTVPQTFQKGEVREFLVTTPPVSLVEKRRTHAKEYILLAILLIASVYVRIFDLKTPNSVVFDEVHFGGFSRKYILGKYFMDVHPPLAKMLFAAVAKLGGFTGNFEFKSIADVYPSSTPYVLMRQFPAVLGIATVFLAYFTLKLSGVRPIIAFITAFLLLIENANVTISRYILLDSPLMFFIASAIYAFKKFEIQQPFSLGYFKTLIGTGIALGLAFSSKWVGLFTIAWVGLLCVYHCWFIIGDLSLSPRKVASQFWWRGSLLLGIPAILYFVFFAIHFNILTNDGDGAAFMSSSFRSTLAGNSIPTDITAQVGLGSVITIKHSNTNGGYLHSHDHFYPTGSKQQQITLYPHLDHNNNWVVEAYNSSLYSNDTFVPLTDGMKIRLRHATTGRRLHSHDEKPPVSERDWQKEASCYGFDGFAGDANDDFVVEIVADQSKNSTSKDVRALETTFRLKHAMSGHYLFSSEVKLPEWGFQQQEVTAASQGKRFLTHWYIETNENPFIQPGDEEIINYQKPSLWGKFVESHKRMWKINQGLTDHHNWQSSPQDWPLLLRGINYWVKDHKQVYLLGNAVTWWTVSVAVLVFGIHFMVSLFKWHTGRPVANNKDVYNFNYQTFSYLLGWGLHYLPFFIMGRQLFIHHYLPAYYFGILALGHFFEVIIAYICGNYKYVQKFGFLVFTVFVALSTLFYVQYSPLIYGTPWTKTQCLSAKVINGWDFDCNTFYATLAEYDQEPSSTQLLPPQQTDIGAVPIVNPGEPNEAKETPAQRVEEAQNEAHQSPAEPEHEEPSEPEQLVPSFEDEETSSKIGEEQKEDVEVDTEHAIKVDHAEVINEEVPPAENQQQVIENIEVPVLEEVSNEDANIAV